MKKSQAQLLRLATKFGNKYAQTQDLKSVIENASSWGDKSVNGIMNFLQKMKEDQVSSLTVDVTINGNSATAGTPQVNPGDKAPNYTRLGEQIAAYLNKNMQTARWNFPNGTTTLAWKNDAVTGVAQR